jgi:hypothetical protein
MVTFKLDVEYVEPGICGSKGVGNPCEPSQVVFTEKVFLWASL